MAKVRDYKVTKVYKKGDSGTYEFLCADIIDALLIAKKKHIKVYAACPLKRRQTIETWVSQISKYVTANQSKLGDFYNSVVYNVLDTYTDENGAEEVIVELC